MCKQKAGFLGIVSQQPGSGPVQSYRVLVLSKNNLPSRFCSGLTGTGNSHRRSRTASASAKRGACHRTDTDPGQAVPVSVYPAEEAAPLRKTATIYRLDLQPFRELLRKQNETFRTKDHLLDLRFSQRWPIRIRFSLL